MSAVDKTSIQINRCKRILALVDDYVEKQDAATRTDLRKALMEEFEPPAIAPPVAADAEPIEAMRANFEDWYTTHAADIKAAPIGSRDSMLQWSSWIAARSGNYVARGGWQISPRPWGPAGAPVAAERAHRGIFIWRTSMQDNAIPATHPRVLLNEGLTKQLIAEFHRRIRSGERPRAVLHSLLHTVYAQGVAAGQKGSQ